jgi:phosphate:Na+ symporter
MMPIVKLISIIIPGKDIYVSTDFQYLQDKLLSTPEIAVESAKKELTAMAEMVQKTVKTAMDGFFDNDKKSIVHVQTQENAIDHLQHDITYYVAKLSAQGLTPDLASQIPPLLHSINDLERISDHAVNIAELTEKASGEELKFSNNALAEMRTLYAKIEDMFQNTIKTVNESSDDTINKVLETEGEVNALQEQYINDHSKRLSEGKCDAMSALIFVDYINNLEKIADHLTNVAQASRSGFSFENLEMNKI